MIKSVWEELEKVTREAFDIVSFGGAIKDSLRWEVQDNGLDQCRTVRLPNQPLNYIKQELENR